MKVPLTKYGWPQVVVLPAAVLTIMVIYLLIGVRFFPAWAIISIEILLATILLWILLFFRDPYRYCPCDKNLLLSPADGTVTNIDTLQEDNFIDGKAIRIGIFMSIFDVHINRSPCNVEVVKITHKKGGYKNAKNPQTGQTNESNELQLFRTDTPEDRLIVRQISGAIARRIVCQAKAGQKLAGGEKFGMVKFGSRTDLYVPARENVKCLVQIGDKVKAGLTPLIKYE